MLTLALPDALQRAADVIRGRLAPDAAARAPAHLGLFRHLPASQLQPIERDMRAMAAGGAPLFRLGPPRCRDGLWMAPAMGEALAAMRDDLADRWRGLLAAPDMGRPLLHISLSRGAPPPPALPEGPWAAQGLLLWRHPGHQCDGACWSPLVACRFRR
ncbi:2'-5' RNA ligase family protein [Sandaracinobacter sp.]|uniref:2'-5' RNA ligase family protein n=1 Tax=Sandaracinobacter sp. TaxID=2487581 RepID=UPI0035B445C2